MPPRKRQRLTPTNDTSHSVPSTSPAATPISPSVTSAPPQEDDPDQDQDQLKETYWPLPQQTALFKSLVQHKPTGPHKHFHTVTIARHLHSQLGYYIPVSSILAKTNELYDLKALDKREGEYAFRSRDKKGDWMPGIYEEEFALPGVVRGEHGVEAGEEGDEVDEGAIAEVWGAEDGERAWFVDAVWRRRFAEGGERQEEGDGQAEEREGEEESPAPSTAASGRGKGRRNTRGTRLSEIKAEDQAEQGEGEEDEEEAEGDEEETTARKGTRSSGRPSRRKKG